MELKMYQQTTTRQPFIEGTRLNGRPAWLYMKKRNKVKIVQIDNNIYTHRFKSYFVPNNASKDELKTFFNFIAPMYDKICPENRRFGEFFWEQIIGMDTSIKILDIMAGTGLPNQILYKAGFKNQLLLDISSGMLTQAKKVMPEIQVKCCSFEHYKPDEKFNVILSALGLHYMSLTWCQFTAKIKKILVSGGYLFVIETRPLPELKGLHWLKEGRLDWFNGEKQVQLYTYKFRN